MKNYCTAILLVLLVGQVSSLALSRHEAYCKTCPAGYVKDRNDCRQVCPAGWANTMTTCLYDYGRGLGYDVIFGGGKARCESENGGGNCEQFGMAYYPKCRAGFTAEGCCICRNQAPPASCSAAGMNPGNPAQSSCTKKLITC